MINHYNYNFCLFPLFFAAFDGTVLDATNGSVAETTDDDCVAGSGSTTDHTVGATVHFEIAAVDIEDDELTNKGKPTDTNDSIMFF